MKYLGVVDTTLRDGEQCPGVYFTRKQKLTLALGLWEAGVPILEAGVPAMGPEELETLKQIGHSLPPGSVTTWNRLQRTDLESALKTGIPRVHISVPTSPQLRRIKLNLTDSQLLEEVENQVTWVQARGGLVSLGAEDASRSSLTFLKSLGLLAQDLKVQYLRFSDTLGLLLPGETRKWFSDLRESLHVPLEFHGHNDLGLVTANGLEALSAGANYLSGTLLGLGERAGNLALEEILGILEFRLNQPTGVDLKELEKVGRRLSKFLGWPWPRHKPFWGSRLFHQEAGIHVQALLKDLEAYFPVSPKKLHRKWTIVPGKHSGKAALEALARQKGIVLSPEVLEAFLQELRSKMTSREGISSIKEWDSFLSRVSGGDK